MNIIYISVLAFTGLFFDDYAASKGKLIWSDEFNYSGSPDPSRWDYQLGNGCPELCGWGNQEIQFYTKELSNVRVSEGKLIIEAHRTDKGWTSARVTSKGKKSFTYGRVEVRAKLPAGKGTWPALWMLGENIDRKGWPWCGEIDIMEHVGRNPGVVQSVIHTKAEHGNTLLKDTIIVSTATEKFHIYSMNWKKDLIEFAVDGKKYYTYRPVKMDPEHWPFSEPQYLLMNLAIGGILGGAEIDPELKSARMEIDYVRVYQ
ncbi:MAG: glycoside hydrolase family 16 protein [Cyclobacteriaceae bacterium]